MKPNFALSLSFEGIRLLHRAADGWRVVGDVGLDSADLAGELAVLRTKASDLSVGGVRTKLIIPNDQIKYISLDTGEQDLSERTRLAIDALVGATPYNVEDLAYAVSADGPRTHIAAVARETLAEAEVFAQEHRFHPVSWVAIPEDGLFRGEPFFGQTKGAAQLIGDSVVEADDTKTVTIGSVITDTGPAITPDESEIDHAVALNEAEDVPATADVPDEIQIDQTSKIEGVADPTLATENAIEEELTDKAVVPIEAPASRKLVSDTTSQTPIETSAVVGFASRRAPEGKTPSLSGARRDISTVDVIAATVPLIEEEPEAAPLVVAEVPEPRITAGFLSRRKKPKSDAIPAPSAVTTKPSTEAQRLTIFGARKPDKKTAVGGKPRFLGLVLTAVLLLFLAGVAAWASVFMDEGLARFFGGPNERSIATAPAGLAPAPEEDTPLVTTASLSDGLSSEDAAVLDALRTPQSDPVVVLPELSPQELAANYAVTGIWAKAPEVPQPAALIPIDDIYVASIDPVSSANDAVALPDVRAFDTDRGLGKQSTPVAAGTAFALGPNGLVIPTLNGAISPDGVTVYLGRPSSVPPKTPVRLIKPENTDPALTAIAKLRPQPRPENLVEQNERSSNGGLSRTELAEQRPRSRPALARAEITPEVEAETQTAQTDAATAAAAASLAALPSARESIIEGLANPQAVRASTRPDGRPRNFARIVKRAIAKQPKDETGQGTRVASVAPRTVIPKIPSSASVAKSATVKNAINLRAVNLIGVYGKPSSRRALVRLSNGRYQKVKVGDRIDGGRVSAIGDAELRYKKGSRNLTLKMPKG
jgi:hypothetical protein